MKTKVDQEYKTNYSFLLKWMAALAAATTAAAIIIAIALAKTAPGLAFGAAALVFSHIPIGAIAAAAVFIGALCLLPFLFCDSSSVVNTNPSCRLSVFWRSPYTYSTPFFGSSYGGYGNYHAHGERVFGSNIHSHG